MNQFRLVAAFFLLLAISANALGGNHVFGILAERRTRMEKVQHARERWAAKNHYSGPNGELLSVEEYRAMHKRSNGLLGVVQGWIRKMPQQA